ncbi:hypothetical protein L0U85_06990 [Glycomyces sp. L485]|uniref:arsenate reductase/protein-tyrosine-phosphatase family protein n=1 Tax=Glycomyces sp. L485 TaxID=2909235 RepID=UPI001F4B07EA|nr:hypothetical protein [Glycomyces sp. L485]
MTEDDPGRTRPFGILYVCTANLCRSVLAERLTRRGIEDRLGQGADRFDVSSAGIRATPGLGMPPQVARYLLRHGADAGSFASRRLSPAIVERADLVLTAARAERDSVIAALPAALARTFTINEFARLATRTTEFAAGTAAETETRVRSIMEEVLTLRGQVARDPCDDDVPDPTRGRRSLQRCTQSIDSAVTAILDVLADGADTPVR